MPKKVGFTSELCTRILAAEAMPHLCPVLETARNFIPPILLLFGVGWTAVLWGRATALYSDQRVCQKPAEEGAVNTVCSGAGSVTDVTESSPFVLSSEDALG